MVHFAAIYILPRSTWLPEINYLMRGAAQSWGFKFRPNYYSLVIFLFIPTGLKVIKAIDPAKKFHLYISYSLILVLGILP